MLTSGSVFHHLNPSNQLSFDFVEECILRDYEEHIGEGRYIHVHPINQYLEQVWTSDWSGTYTRWRSNKMNILSGIDPDSDFATRSSYE